MCSVYVKMESYGGAAMNNLQIEYFLAVEENLSFTVTAAKKYVSQPAISKQIMAMEEELGVLLFERGRKTTKLTEAGKLFADYYRRQRDELNMLTLQAREIQDKIYVPLTIAFGAGWTLAHFLPDVIQKVQKRINTTRVILACNELLNLETMLKKDHADVIISVDISVHTMPNIEIRPLANVPGVLIYTEKLPAAVNAKAPKDFKDEVFFIPMERELDLIVNLVNSFVEPYGFTPKIERVANVESMLANVVNGLGVAIVDKWVVSKSQHALLTMPIGTEYAIVVAWKKGNKNPALSIFLDELFKLPIQTLI